ncbi:MAG: cyclase family protein, partial [Acidobacteria bacterium]|nr:cyclase family protein [Acidobacteriota bacterium]
MNVYRRSFLVAVLTLFCWWFEGASAFKRSELQAQEAAAIRGWKQGQGWGWIWGKEDEVGSLNAINPSMVLKAISLVKQGKVYDLGVSYDRTSYKWPGHSPGEVLSFRTPEGVKRQKDLDFTLPAANKAGLAWHSSALFINDNVATQIDGLGHITTGEDNHWYNGFKEADWGGNWGIRKTDVTTIPPMVLRAVLVDVAGFKKVEALKGSTTITVDDLRKTLEWEKTDIHPGDAV